MDRQPPAGNAPQVHWPWPGSRHGAIPIGGTAIKATGGGIEQVIVMDAASRAIVDAVIPNARSGEWSLDVHPGSYMLMYLALGCAPITHGPYTVTA